MNYSVHRRFLPSCGRPRATRTRSSLHCSRLDVSIVAERIHNAFTEVCIENQGRPAAAALSDFVAASLLTKGDEIRLNTILLELEYGSAAIEAAGYRLTTSDRSYRRQWILTVLMTRTLFAAICEGEAVTSDRLQQWSKQDPSLFRIVSVTLQQLVTQKSDQQIKFDRSLATRGISGGVASQCIVIAPQFVPISQLVLLTVKHLREMKSQENQSN